MDGATPGDAAHLRRLIQTHLDVSVTPVAMNRSDDPPGDGDPLPDVAAAPAGLLARERTPDDGDA